MKRSETLAIQLIENEGAGSPDHVRAFILGDTPEQKADAERIATAKANKQEFFANHDKKYSAQRALGDVTPDTNASTFWHRTVKYADGRTAYQVRRNGKTQRWSTQPDKFRIPIRIGFRGTGQITHVDAHMYTTIEPAPLPKPQKTRGVQ